MKKRNLVLTMTAVIVIAIASLLASCGQEGTAGKEGAAAGEQNGAEPVEYGTADTYTYTYTWTKGVQGFWDFTLHRSDKPDKPRNNYTVVFEIEGKISAYYYVTGGTLSLDVKYDLGDDTSPRVCVIDVVDVTDKKTKDVETVEQLISLLTEEQKTNVYDLGKISPQ